MRYNGPPAQAATPVTTVYEQHAGGSAVDLSAIPLRAGTPSPGVSVKASPADHVHPAPLLTDFTDFDMTGAADGQVLTYDGAAGKIRPKAATGGAGLAPLWTSIDNGDITLARGHTDDSGSYGSNPASGEMRLSYFVAQKSGSRGTIRFQTGGSAAATSTLARVGLYTVDTSGNLTLVASCANKTTFTGTYAGQNCVLTAAYTVTAGTVYAVGILQVATTPSSLAGAWFNGTFLGAGPKLARKATGLADLPATVANGALGDTQFPVYCEVIV